MPVTCSRCGAENPAAARYCMSCANPLPVSETAPAAGTGAGEADATAPPATAATASVGSPPADTDAFPGRAAAPRPQPGSSGLPPQFRSLRAAPSHVPPTDPEWRMSPAGPLPDPPKRRIWVWVLVAVGAVLLLCVVLTLIGSLVGNPNLQAPAGP